METDLKKLVEDVKDIAIKAGGAILEYFEDGDFEQYDKSDHSPVTSADYAANDIVISSLQSLTPNIPIISEESEGLVFSDRKQWAEYWLVDPLDGTQEFVAGRPDFAVNIALIQNNKPVLGVIHAPVTEDTYWATKDQGAFKQTKSSTSKISGNKIDTAKHSLTVAISRVQKLDSITKYIIDGVDLSFISLGSCALKSCLVAEGKADVYPRFAPTMEWDTAAGQAICNALNITVRSIETNESLRYNKENLLNSHFLVGDTYE